MIFDYKLITGKLIKEINEEWLDLFIVLNFTNH